MKNRKLRDELVTVIKEAGAEDGCDKARGDLLYEVAVKASASSLAVCHRFSPAALVYNYDGFIFASSALQYPKEASLDHRPAFLREFIMTAKVKVRCPVAT